MKLTRKYHPPDKDKPKSCPNTDLKILTHDEQRSYEKQASQIRLNWRSFRAVSSTIGANSKSFRGNSVTIQAI